MIREAYQDLLQWKARPNRKPLIIQGARQVGKTWLMKTFGSTEYAQLAYFNFEQSTMLYQIFQQGFDVRRIITSLEIALGKSIQSENTLLVFDEIQACPEAITALKYFQENAPELATRAQDYFRTSINVEIEIAGLVRLHDTHIAADPVQIERGLRRVANANYIFAGPGSPTYALRQWSGSPIASTIAGKLQTGGIVTFASAAALTLGKATVPVYEVYKVGQDVERLEGLDILSSIGINAAVIPHYDNAEGGNHDTRFCYLGETRLELFETMLDSDTYVLGVDEHTGLMLDLDVEFKRSIWACITGKVIETSSPAH